MVSLIVHTARALMFLLSEPFGANRWNQIIPVLIQRKVLVIHPTDPGYRQLSHGLFISQEIKAINLWIQKGKTEISIHAFEDPAR